MRTTFKINCPQCEEEITLTYHSETSPILNPPDKADPGSPAEIEPTYCEECDYEFSEKEIDNFIEKGADELEDQYAESRISQYEDD